MWALDPVPARAPVSAAAEAALVIAVSHLVRALVRAVTLLVPPDLAAALRDQPAVEEVIAWAAVASAVVVAAAVVAAEEAAADADDKQTMQTGQASSLLQRELQNLGFTLRDRMNPGPLK
jgi:hypothetical protein